MRKRVQLEVARNEIGDESDGQSSLHMAVMDLLRIGSCSGTTASDLRGEVVDLEGQRCSLIAKASMRFFTGRALKRNRSSSVPNDRK